MKKTLELTVNDQAVSRLVEPRMQLADFLRDELLLTGTHVGCEHGVCGACTLEIDGAPARSCITYAVACNGAAIRTIEGFEDDTVMVDLREAFSAEHALQCGYCTPGMLITARDIVMRLPQADEARIRTELAGNLCRCTGYVGIVRAIQSVMVKRGHVHRTPVALTPREPANVAAERPERRAGTHHPERVPVALLAEKAEKPISRPEPEAQREPAKHATTLQQAFSIAHPRDRVWDFFGRLDQITLCLPGTSLVGPPRNDHVDTAIRIKVGPIVAEFAGAADAVRDALTYTGVIHGSARDARTGSTTRGEIRYSLLEEAGQATHVEVSVSYTLTGPLAQFSRSGIVLDIARRMTAAFAQNLEARLKEGDDGTSAARIAPGEIDAGSLVFAVFRERIRALVHKLFGRR